MHCPMSNMLLLQLTSGGALQDGSNQPHRLQKLSTVQSHVLTLSLTVLGAAHADGLQPPPGWQQRQQLASSCRAEGLVGCRMAEEPPPPHLLEWTCTEERRCLAHCSWPCCAQARPTTTLVSHAIRCARSAARFTPPIPALGANYKTTSMASAELAPACLDIRALMLP